MLKFLLVTNAICNRELQLSCYSKAWGVKNVTICSI